MKSMASKKKIIEMLTAMKTIYSYYAKDTDLELLVNTWHILLKDYSDEEVEAAFYIAFKRCKMACTPADIVSGINDIRNQNKPSTVDLWAIYNDALREVLYLSHRFNYTYVDLSGLSQGEQARRRVDEIWEGLPQELKMYLGEKNELIRNARELNFAENSSWERNRFLKTLPIIEERINTKFLLLGAQNFLE